MITKIAKASLHVLMIAMLASGAVMLQMVRGGRSDAIAVSPFLYFTSPEVVRRMALSFDALFADIYWIRLVQYYGGTRLSDRPNKNYDLLYPYLDLTTTLDPHFRIVYRFGAFFLAEPLPGGAGRTDLAVKLLQKGMAADPKRWEYPYDVGFVYYRLKDYPQAARWFQRAADVENAPNWLTPLAAVTLATGGDTRSSRLVWMNLVNSDIKWIRNTAELRLLQLDAIDQIAELERRTAEYERRYGDPPQTWEDMIRAGLLRAIPLDPSGAPYVLNPWWGDVTVAETSPMWPLPTERPA